MHLKRIRLYGFKSFAQDTSVEFEPGITALVGPNGGGKSNVVDAIRWALGEQRLRDLRAERWEDLLYQGSPGAAAARLAEVTLEFDNQDGEMPHWPESLSVSRRYYRSGDSEYLVNGQAVRLKDVTDLFLDSGLGRFSYAIISQGRVEGALMQRPVDRLEQLEEAAGVSRYKVRRRETVTHLKETEDKLVRLTDLSDEVGRQMEEVRERAEKESRYRTWELLRQDWQQRLTYTDYRKAMEKSERLDQQLARLDEERRQLAAELSRVLVEASQTRETVQQNSTELENEAEGLLALTERATNWRLKKGEIEGKLVSVAQEGQRIVESLALLAEQQRDLTRERDESQVEESADIRQPDDIVELKDRLAAIERDRDRVQDERRQAEVRIAGLGEQRNRAEQRLARIQGILRMSNTDNLVETMKALRADALFMEGEVRRLTSEVDRLTGERTRIKEFTSHLEQEIYSLNHQLAGRQARLRALHQLDAEGEGLHAGVRAVLRGQQEGKISGVMGTLASLLKSPPDLTLAIDTALGGSRQDVVMGNEQEARDAVQYLKTGALGRATFLPLDTVRGTRVSNDDYRRLGREAGVVGWAADLVQTEATVRPAVQHVLGRVLIVQRLEEASRLGSVHNYRYKMVTLDGQVVHAGGAITGGSRRSDKSSLKSRQVEVDELTQRIRQDSEVVAAKEELLYSSRLEVDEVGQQLDQYRELLAERRHAWQELRQGLLLEEEMGHPDELIQETQRLESESQATRAALGRLASEEEGLETLRLEILRQVESAEDLRREQEQARRERALIEERRTRELDRLRQQAQNYRDRQAALEREERDLSSELAAANGSLDEALSASSSYERERLVRVKALNTLREQLVTLDNRQRVLELEDRKMEQKVNTWNQERLEIQVRFEEYQAPASNVEPLTRGEEENARREVQRITASLNEIGPVIPGSLAIFEQLQERRAYLVQESQDVEEARSDLLATLQEIDAEMDRRVKATATQVEHAFSEACRQLYGGGDGGFSWSEGDQPGVDLWVRSAGKRPSHLGLLSGGEKALGGIAWLFSLLAVRPSPFVVLDEVEASLDEANAVRFAHYLRTARGTAQYVVVTHQRQTMEAADALWGVAGDSQGKSRLVSVRLADVEEDSVTS